LESVKKCVTTYLRNELVLLIFGDVLMRSYFFVAGCVYCIEGGDCLLLEWYALQILVLVAF